MTGLEPMSSVAKSEIAPSRGRTFARRVLAVLLLTLSSVLFLLAGWTNVASSLAGSPKATADAILAVVTSTNVRHAVAVKLVDQIRKDSSGATGRAIAQHRAQLVVAVEGIIADPVTQRIARADFVRAYDALAAHRSERIDLRPLIYRFTQVMHAIDPQIPLKPTGLKHAVVTIRRRNYPLRAAGSFFPIELILVGLSLLGATLTTGFLVRRSRHQYWALGLTLGVPALLLMGGGLVLRGVVRALHFSDPNAKLIAIEAAKRISNVFIVTGLLLGLITVIALSAWYLGRRRRFRRPAVAL